MLGSQISFGSSLSTWDHDWVKVVRSSDNSLKSASALLSCPNKPSADAVKFESNIPSSGRSRILGELKSQDASIHRVTLRLPQRNAVNSLASCCQEPLLDASTCTILVSS